MIGWLWSDPSLGRRTSASIMWAAPVQMKEYLQNRDCRCHGQCPFEKEERSLVPANMLKIFFKELNSSITQSIYTEWRDYYDSRRL